MRVVINPLKLLFITGIVVTLVLLGLLFVYREALMLLIVSGAFPMTVVVPQVAAVFLVLTAFYISSRSVLRGQRNEQALRVSQARFSELYTSSPVPYITLNDKGTVTMANLAAIRLFDCAEGELDGAPLSELLTHEKDNKLSVILGKLQGGSTIHEAEVQVLTKEEKTVWVLLSVFSYGASGERLVTIVDISKQKEVEAAKTEFVSLASHQLRTPISVIQWNLELLQSPKNGDLTDKQAKYFEKIARNATRMSVLINDFLSASKLELGTFATKTTGIPLVPFMQSIEEEFEVRAQKKRLTVLTTYTPEDFVMQADERLLHIIVSNLMSNAVKYTPQDGEVRLSYEVTDTHVIIIVTDTGMGVPESEHRNLFSKFYRASNAQKEVSEGTGLGLYMVRRAAQMLRGDIVFESVQDKGTTFTVTLPRL